MTIVAAPQAPSKLIYAYVTETLLSGSSLEIRDETREWSEGGAGGRVVVTWGTPAPRVTAGYPCPRAYAVRLSFNFYRPRPAKSVTIVHIAPTLGSEPRTSITT